MLARMVGLDCAVVGAGGSERRTRLRVDGRRAIAALRQPDRYRRPAAADIPYGRAPDDPLFRRQRGSGIRKLAARTVAVGAVGSPRRPSRRRAGLADRESTRLNSSN